MTVDDTLDRLAALDETEQDDLAERYWDDLNAMHPRNRTGNTLEPILDEYAADHDDLKRFDLGMAAGELGSRIHHYDRHHDTVKEAVHCLYNETQRIKDDAPASAEYMEIMIEDVLPEYMDDIGV